MRKGLQQVNDPKVPDRFMTEKMGLRSTYDQKDGLSIIVIGFG